MRHFQRGMASVPEWAPRDESHLLGSTSVVRNIHYGGHQVDYLTFDKSAREVLRLRDAPTSVRAGGKPLPRVAGLSDSTEGYTVDAITRGGVAIRIQHRHSGEIRIQ